MKELLNTKQICEVLGTGRRNIEKLRHKGLPFYALGPQGSPRFDYDEVRAWLRENAKQKHQRKQRQEDVVFD